MTFFLMWMSLLRSLVSLFRTRTLTVTATSFSGVQWFFFVGFMFLVFSTSNLSSTPVNLTMWPPPRLPNQVHTERHRSMRHTEWGCHLPTFISTQALLVPYKIWESIGVKISLYAFLFHWLGYIHTIDFRFPASLLYTCWDTYSLLVDGPLLVTCPPAYTILHLLSFVPNDMICFLARLIIKYALL